MGSQLKSPSLFDHVNVSQISIQLNDTTYPAQNVIADFKKHQYVQYYKMFVGFGPSENWVDLITYKEEYPIFYFDVSKQSERLNNGVADLMVRMKFASATEQNLQAYASIISDRRIKFGGDGNKMNIIY